MPEEIRFIADAMLGKLATWLRLLGCDVEYLPRMSDDDIVERAFLTGRVILTRDTELIRRRKARGHHFFVRGDGYRCQLRQVVERFSLAPFDRIMTRCLRCNEMLVPADRGTVRERVPHYVYETHQEFMTCGHCGRIYWKGTHRDKALSEVRRIFGSD